MPDLERQLRLLRAFALLNYPFACVPFLFLYFQQHGLDAQGYGEVIAAYYVAMFVCEVPTGMLADRFGPKYMLVTGPLLLTAGFATLLAVPTYGGFLGGEVLLGMGHAVLSGPPATLLFETLRAQGKGLDYLRQESRNSALRLFGTGSAFLLGGLVAHAAGNAYERTIALTCTLTFAAAVVATRLATPPHRPRLSRAAFLGHLGAALGKRPLRWLLLYWVVLFTLLRFPFHEYQPYLAAASEQEPLLGNALLVGGVFALLNLVAAPLSAALPWLVARLGRRLLFWSMPVVLGLSLLLMAGERHLAANGDGSRWLAWLGVTMFFVQQVPFGLHWALLYEFVNHRLGSEVRTTVLSILSLGCRLCYAGFNVLLFSWQQHRGMAAALAVAGLGGLFATVLVMLLRPRGLLTGSERLDDG
ncbi:MAG: MFS transporter [Planctomycetes bacterium]|nr:MFS transporter [Planctomycetota bacterium]